MADIFNMADAWNNAGTTFTAIRMDVTDTASAAGSKLVDLLTGGVSKFSVDKAGNASAAGTLSSAGTAIFGGGVVNEYTAGVAYVYGYAGAWKPLRLMGSSVELQYQGITVASVTATGLAVTGDTTTSGVFKVGADQVLGARKTGWVAASGTSTRTTFATATVTTAQLAERVKALVDDLISHGAIGA